MAKKQPDPWPTINKLQEADVDSGYILETIIIVVKKEGISQAVIDALRKRWYELFEEDN